MLITTCRTVLSVQLRSDTPRECGDGLMDLQLRPYILALMVNQTPQVKLLAVGLLIESACGVKV